MTSELDEELDKPRHVLERAAQDDVIREWVADQLEDLARAERRVRQDYGNRYPIELLQNAHDAAAEAGLVGRVWFQLTETALIVANEGEPFTKERLRALVRLGASSKRRTDFKRHVVGYKGIGFSSVEAITDAPQVYSAGVMFGFDKSRADDAIKRNLGRILRPVPIRALPFRIQEADWDTDWHVAEELVRQGAVTVIRLPVRSGVALEDVWENVRRTLAIETLLFLPHVREVSLKGPTMTAVWRRREGKRVGAGQLVHLEGGDRTETWLVAVDRARAPEAATKALDDEIWRQVTHLSVAAAIPWRGRSPDPERPPQPVYVYFPTEDILGRPLILHGDFFVASSRRSIQTSGPEGEVTRTVAEASVGLAARLVESIAGSDGLLQALAPHAASEGFGKKLGEMLDERLKDCRIVRAAGGKRLWKAAELRLFEPGLPDPADDDLLLRLLRNKARIAHPRDAAGAGALLLRSLGTAQMRARDVAENLGHATHREYARCLKVIMKWVQRLSEYERWWAVRALEQTPILLDQDGRWRPPSALMLSTEGVPLPPPSLRRGIAHLPDDPSLRAFVRYDLEVDELSADQVLDDVVDRLNAGTYGRTPDERRALLRWLLRLYEHDPDLVASRGAELSELVQVPVRNARAARSQWLPAGEAYLLPPTVDGGPSPLEILYGRSELPAFVDVEQIPGFDRSDRHHQMLCAIGIATRPRIRTYELLVAPGEVPEDAPLTHLGEWLETPMAEKAMRCPAGPARDRWKERSIQTPCIDRLDEMLDRRDRNRLKALAAFVAEERSKVFEEHARIRCTGTSHQSQSYGTESYQAWRLRTTAWIPVTEPDGSSGYERPDRAWFGLPREPVLLLARADLPEQVAEAVGCASGLKPLRMPLEQALRDLARRYRDIDADERVAATARWLMERLDVLDERPNPRDPEDRPPFLALRGGKRVWTREPIVPDLAHVGRLSTLTILPEGRWYGLARDYQLRRASEIVSCEPQLGPKLPYPPLLDERTKAELVALLSPGADKRTVARNLGRLFEYRVRSVRLELRHGDEPVVTAPLTHYLHVTRDAKQEVTRTTLLVSAELREPTLELCRDLARYLVTERRAEDVAFRLFSYFKDREQVLQAHQVTPSSVREAEEALARYTPEEPLSSTFTFADWLPWREEAELLPGGMTSSDAPADGLAPAGDGARTRPSSQGTDLVAREPRRGAHEGARHEEANDVDAPRRAHREPTPAAPHPDRERPPSSRQRLRSYVFSDATGGPTEDDVAPDGSAVDQAGMQAVLMLEAQEGRNAKPQAHANPGYDILSEDPRTGETRFIEVKSLESTWSGYGVGLTRRQYDMALREGPRYWLYVVEQATSGFPRIYKIRDPASSVAEYRFDEGWKAVAEEP